MVFEGLEGGKTVIGIYSMRKKSAFNERQKKKKKRKPSGTFESLFMFIIFIILYSLYYIHYLFRTEFFCVTTLAVLECAL